jgi:hypothetical protein
VDPDADLDPNFHPDTDPDPSFQRKAQTLENVLKQAHIPYFLACHLQVDANPPIRIHFRIQSSVVNTAVKGQGIGMLIFKKSLAPLKHDPPKAFT